MSRPSWVGSRSSMHTSTHLPSCQNRNLKMGKNYSCERWYCQLAIIYGPRYLSLSVLANLYYPQVDPSISLGFWDIFCNNSPKKTRPVQNHLQNSEPAIVFFFNWGTPNLSRPSGLTDNAEPSLQIILNL